MNNAHELLRGAVVEKQNVEADHPAEVARLTKLLKKYVADGRSTPGPVQKNDAGINIWKKPLAKGERNERIGD